MPQPPLLLRDLDATTQLAQAIAGLITPGFSLHLSGDLGAGKTTLTRAILRHLGVVGSIKSPTYALVEPYEVAQLAGGVLHHFDFYRLQSPDEWRAAGFEEAFAVPHAAIVEWADNAAGLPPASVLIELSHAADVGEHARRARLTGNPQIMQRLQHAQNAAAAQDKTDA